MYTEQPWTAEQNGDEWNIWGGSAKQFRVLTIRDGVIPQNHDRDLILAAPELLAACVALLDVQSSRRHPLGAPDEGIATAAAEAASKARAAIAKATGTTQP